MGFAKVTQDITAQKTAEEATLQSEARLRLALDSGNIAVWDIDIDTQEVTATGALFDMLDVPTERKIVFDDWVALNHPEDQAAMREQFDVSSRGLGNAVELEHRVRAQDGSWRWLETRARIVKYDSEGSAEVITGTCLDITARKLGVEQLLHAAQHDSLTGLPNRALTYAFGERLLEAAPRHGGQCAVMFIDIDRFKPINDIYGHAAGDAVLREIALRIQSCVRSEDVVGRLGGDEFLLILAHVHQTEDIIRIANNCLVATSRPCFYLDLELQVSASIGISLYPKDGRNMDRLLKHSDKAMYLFMSCSLTR